MPEKDKRQQFFNEAIKPMGILNDYSEFEKITSDPKSNEQFFNEALKPMGIMNDWNEYQELVKKKSDFQKPFQFSQTRKGGVEQFAGKQSAPTTSLDLSKSGQQGSTQPTDYGLRVDGTKKGKGWLGELQLPNGGVATEYTIGIELDGKEVDIPTLVPTLSKQEIDLMINDIIPNNKPVPQSIETKAVQFAKERMNKGLSTFAPTGIQDYDFTGKAGVVEPQVQTEYPAGDVPVEKPVIKEEEELTYGGALSKSFERSSLILGQMMVNTPSMIYSVFALPQNIIADLTGLPIGAKAEDIGLGTGGATEYYRKELEKSNERIQQRYDKGITDYFTSGKEGDIQKGFELLSMQILETLPITATLMMGSAAGLTAPQSIFGFGTSFAGSEMQELNNNPETAGLPESLKTINAMTKGVLDGALEQAGLTKMGTGLKALLKGASKEQIEQVSKKTFYQVYAPIFRKYLGSAAEESMQEGATELSHQMVDLMQGLRDDVEFRPILDAMIVGLAAGATIGSVQPILEVGTTSKSRKEKKENLLTKEALNKDLTNPNVPDAAKEAINKKIQSLNETEAQEYANEKVKLENLSETDVQNVNKLISDIVEIEQALENTELTEESKKSLEENIKEKQAEVDSIIQQAEKERVEKAPEKTEEELLRERFAERLDEIEEAPVEAEVVEQVVEKEEIKEEQTPVAEQEQVLEVKPEVEVKEEVKPIKDETPPEADNKGELKHTTTKGEQIYFKDGNITIFDKDGKEIPTQIKDKKGKLILNPKVSKIRTEYRDHVDISKGRDMEDVTKDMVDKGELEVMSLENIDRSEMIATFSENPLQVLTEMNNVEKYTTHMDRDIKEQAIANHIRKFRRQDFIDFGDKNLITKGMAEAYFKGTHKLEDILLDANGEFVKENEGYGKEVVTMSDVIDFIVKYPNGTTQFDKQISKRYKMLDMRFFELTGIRVTDKLLNRANKINEKANKVADKVIEKVIEKVDKEEYNSMTNKEWNEFLEKVKEAPAIEEVLGIQEKDIKKDIQDYKTYVESFKIKSDERTGQDGTITEDNSGQVERPSDKEDVNKAKQREVAKVKSEFAVKIKPLEDEVQDLKDNRDKAIRKEVDRLNKKIGLFGVKDESLDVGAGQVEKSEFDAAIDKFTKDYDANIFNKEKAIDKLRQSEKKEINAIENQQDLFEDKSEAAKDKIAKGIDGLIDKMGGKKSLLPEQRTTLINDVKNIIEGLSELTIEKIREIVADMLNTRKAKLGLTDKEVVDMVNEIAPLKEEVKTEKVETKVSGIKKALVPENRRIDYGTLSDKEAIAEGKKIRQSGEVDAKAVVDEITDGNERALQPKEVVALLDYKVELDNKLDNIYEKITKAKEIGDDPIELIAQSKVLENDLQNFEAMSVITAAQQSMAFRLRRYLLDRQYNLQKQIYKYKAKNKDGKIHADVERRFKEAAEEIKRLEKAIEEERKKVQEAEAKLAETSIKEEQKRILKEQASNKNATIKAKRIADFLRKGKLARPEIFAMATPASIIFDTAIEITAKTIEAGGKTIDAINNGLNKIRKSDWYKSLSKTKQQDAETRFTEYVNNNYKEAVKTEKETITFDEEGKIKITNTKIKELIKEGFETIEEWTDIIYNELIEDNPDITKSDVMDAITGYGKTKAMTKNEIEKLIMEQKSIGRLISAIEDVVEKRQNPKRSGQQRRKDIERERMLRKQLREAMKDLPQADADIEAKWKSLLGKRKQQLDNEIEALDRQIAAGKRDVKNDKGIEYDEETREKIKIRDAKKEELDRLDPKERKGLTDEERINRAITMLDNQIVELDRQIEEGDIERKKQGKKTPETPEIKAKREYRDAQKQVLEEMRKEAGVIDKERMERAKKNMQKKTDKLNERLKNKDFSKKTRVPIVPDTELAKLESEYLRVKEIFEVEHYKNELNNRTMPQKARDMLLETFALTRMIAGIDLSAVMIQGLVRTTTRPKQAARAMKEMFKQLASEKKHKEFITKLKSSDIYREIKAAGGYISDDSPQFKAREEQFQSGWVNQVWNMIGKATFAQVSDSAYKAWVNVNPYRVGQRAFEAYLNMMRVQAYMEYFDMLKREGMTIENNPKDFKAAASWINNATGRGKLVGGLEKAADVLTLPFFSPRKIAANFNVLNPRYYLKMYNRSPVMAKAAMKNMLQFVGVAATTLVLASLTGDDDDPVVEFDPRSSNFLKIKVGDNKYIDILAGHSQIITMFSRLFTNSTMRDGKIEKLGMGYGKPTQYDVIRRFFESKASPSAGLLLRYTSARVQEDGSRISVFGEEITLKSEIMRGTIPIWMQNIGELYDEGDPLTNTGIGFLMMLGAGVTIKEEKKKKKRRKKTPEKN